MQIAHDPLTFNAARDVLRFSKSHRNNDLIPQNHKVIWASSAQLCQRCHKRLIRRSRINCSRNTKADRLLMQNSNTARAVRGEREGVSKPGNWLHNEDIRFGSGTRLNPSPRQRTLDFIHQTSTAFASEWNGSASFGPANWAFLLTAFTSTHLSWFCLLVLARCLAVSRPPAAPAAFSLLPTALPGPVFGLAGNPFSLSIDAVCENMQSGCKRIAMMIVYCNFYDCFAHKHAKAAMMIAARRGTCNLTPSLPPTRL